MKIFKGICFVVMTLLLLLAGAGLLYIQFFAKNAIQSKLSETFNHPVALSGVSYHFPFGLKLSQLSVGDTVSVSRIYLQVNPQTLFEPAIGITQFDLIAPVLVLKDQGLSWAGATEDGKPAVPGDNNAGTPVKKKTYNIGKVGITNGRLDIVQTGGQSSLKIELANVRGSFLNVQAPWGPGKIDFKFEASATILNGPLAPRQVTGRGWIDPHQKDIHGNIFFRDPNGREQLSMELSAGDNELEIDGVLKMEIAESEEEMPQESAVEKMLSQAMAQAAEGENVQFETRFSVREKLDEFRLDRLKVDFQGSATAPDPVEKKVLPSE